MKFYLSSSLRNRAQVRRAANFLKENGWTHTCDWTEFELSSEEGTDGLQRIDEREFEGVKTADIVIVLTPQGRGTHIELGMALALGKKVYLYHEDNSFFQCDDATCAFYWLPQVSRLTGKLEEALTTVLHENQ